MTSFAYESTLRVCFPSARFAGIVEKTLAVDAELRPDKVCRTSSVEGAALVVRFQATELRMLRVAMSSYFDMAMVAVQTLQEFAD